MASSPTQMVAIARAREAKCTALAAWLASRFLEVVQGQNDEEWKDSAVRAGVNEPSDESKKRVIEILKTRLGA